MTDRQDHPFDAATDDGPTSLVRREEELRVGVERVVTERVVVRRRIVTEERTITVPVRREEIEIVREPVTGEGGSAGLADDGWGSGDVVEIIVRAEEPVVGVEVRDVERVVLQRTRHSEEQVVSADVAREVVDVEDTTADRATDTGIDTTTDPAADLGPRV